MAIEPLAEDDLEDVARGDVLLGAAHVFFKLGLRKITLPAILGATNGRLGWGQRQSQVRDDRVEAFSSLLWEGVHAYAYVARATTPGTFIVPPPKAEEMYAPETFGRGATDRVVVEETA